MSSGMTHTFLPLKKKEVNLKDECASLVRTHPVKTERTIKKVAPIGLKDNQYFKKERKMRFD